MNTTERYRIAADGFARRLAQCATDPAAVAGPSPCPGWTGVDVIDHAVAVQEQVLAAVVPAGSGVAATAPPAQRWNAVTAAILNALDDPVLGATEVPNLAGTGPFRHLVASVGVTDALIHTWDLSVAAGLDRRLDPALVAAVLPGLRATAEHLRAPGLYGPAVPVGDDPDPQDELLGVLGRDPVDPLGR